MLRTPAARPAPASLLTIENVGNFVWPALFDLGERAVAHALTVNPRLMVFRLSAYSEEGLPERHRGVRSTVMYCD